MRRRKINKMTTEELWEKLTKAKANCQGSKYHEHLITRLKSSRRIIYIPQHDKCFEKRNNIY